MEQTHFLNSIPRIFITFCFIVIVNVSIIKQGDNK